MDLHGNNLVLGSLLSTAHNNKNNYCQNLGYNKDNELGRCNFPLQDRKSIGNQAI